MRHAPPRRAPYEKDPKDAESYAKREKRPTNVGSGSSMRGERRTEPSKASGKRRQSSLIEKIKSKMSPKLTVLAAVGVVLLALIVCILVNIIIGVRSIEITGNRLAPDDEITSVAGVSPGSGYFSYNTGKAEKAVLENIHCISEINISRSFFGKVRITVTEKNACWYTEIYGEYYVLSDSLEVIRRSDMRDEFVNHGLVRLDFPEVKSTILGKKVEYSDEGRDCSFIPGFLDAIRENQLYKDGRIDQIKLENKFKIFAVCDLKFKISLGKSENVSDKLDSAAKAIAKIDDGGKYVLNVTDPGNISVYKDENLDFSYLKPIFDKK